MLYKRGLTAQAKPNPTHYAIAELNKLGKLDCVITQNVDNLHQRIEVPDDKVSKSTNATQRGKRLSGQCSKRKLSSISTVHETFSGTVGLSFMG